MGVKNVELFHANDVLMVYYTIGVHSRSGTPLVSSRMWLQGARLRLSSDSDLVESE